MKNDLFFKLFSTLSTPVVVADVNKESQIVFLNQAAGLLLRPSYSVEALIGKYDDTVGFDQIFNFAKDEEKVLFKNIVESNQSIDKYHTTIISFDGESIDVNISGNIIEINDTSYFVFYINEEIIDSEEANIELDSRMSEIMNATFLNEEVEENIQTTIDLAGEYVDVSRVYVFEEIDEETTANTYEWCDEDSEPAIQDLQSLKKADYNYNTIINSGVYITNDVRDLPDGDREILQMQGIKALAIITIYDGEKPLGYVGFDDCDNYRNWSRKEIQFLQNISGLVGLFVKRRNAEEKARLSQDVLQTIFDNTHEVIYVNSLTDYKLKFVSSVLCENLGIEAEDAIGKKCYEVIQANKTEPCSFCPIPKIPWDPSKGNSEHYQWETTNSITKKTFLAKDSIIKWVNGEYVHIETAIDITIRKSYERELQYFASTDMMTDIYNREWGSQLLEKNIGNTNKPVSICFIDLDGLKFVNDTYGHSAGDRMILGMVRSAKNHIDEEADELICRWGGDEFILYFNGDEEYAKNKIKLIEKEIDNLNKHTEDSFDINFSHGIVEVPPEASGTPDSVDAIVKEADELMYEHKMSKRNRLQRRRRTDKME